MSDLERLQVDVVRTMEAASYFADIACFWLRPRVQADGSVQTVPEIQSAIDGALAGLTTKAGKSGAAVTVLMPTLECPDPAEVGPPIELSLALLVEEIPFVNMDATNGTRKTAEDIVLELLPLFHLREFQPNTVLLADRKAAEPMLDPASGKLTYEVRFRSRFRFGPQTLCGKPFITTAAAYALATWALNAAGTGYATGDTITLAGGTAITPAVFTITSTRVAAVTGLVNGGTGGTDGTRSAQGTTGTGVVFSVSVTVSGGAITAIGSITQAGTYTVNPTNVNDEPVVGAGIPAGARLSVAMGVRGHQMTTAGVYADTGTTAFTQGSTSGGGSGATFQSATFTTANLVTLTSGTAGASIYYTTDESFPRFASSIGGAGATGSTLYSAPFIASSGAIVRAAAYKTGTTASHVTQKTV
jgi:hypothetical protein